MLASHSGACIWLTLGSGFFPSAPLDMGLGPDLGVCAFGSVVLTRHRRPRGVGLGLHGCFGDTEDDLKTKVLVDFFVQWHDCWWGGCIRLPHGTPQRNHLRQRVTITLTRLRVFFVAVNGPSLVCRIATRPNRRLGVSLTKAIPKKVPGQQSRRLSI